MKQNTTKLGVYWRISKTRPSVLLLGVKILLLHTQNVQLRVRTSTGLEKVRVEHLFANE